MDMPAVHLKDGERRGRHAVYKHTGAHTCCVIVIYLAAIHGKNTTRYHLHAAAFAADIPADVTAVHGESASKHHQHTAADVAGRTIRPRSFIADDAAANRTSRQAIAFHGKGSRHANPDAAALIGTIARRQIGGMADGAPAPHGEGA